MQNIVDEIMELCRNGMLRQDLFRLLDYPKKDVSKAIKLAVSQGLEEKNLKKPG